MPSHAESPPEPPRRGPAPTKQVDILWAAARLFARQGVAQTTTREVAAAAQTTERTLFKHFGSKEALAHAVIAEAVLPHLAPASLAAMRSAIEAHEGDVAAWHRALLKSRHEAMAAAPELTRLLLMEIIRDDALRLRFAATWAEAVWRPLSELFGRMQREGRLRRDIPRDSLARAFLSLNLGFLIGRHVLAPDHTWNERAEMAAVAALFARGAAPSP